MYLSDYHFFYFIYSGLPTALSICFSSSSFLLCLPGPHSSIFGCGSLSPDVFCIDSVTSYPRIAPTALLSVRIEFGMYVQCASLVCL